MTATETAGGQAPAPPAARLQAARRMLGEACAEQDPELRYGCAYLAALHAAAALTAPRDPGGDPAGRDGPGNLWERVAVSPLAGWAVPFAARGRARPAGPRQADSLVRDAEAFITAVEQHLSAPA